MQVHYSGFSVFYDDNAPRVVKWSLPRKPPTDRICKRCDFFAEPFSAPRKLFVKKDYDIGHFFPFQDYVYQDDPEKSAHDSMSLANVCLQHYAVNRNVWLELEHSTRKWANSGQVSIEAGCIGQGVCPDYLWKIVHVQTTNHHNYAFDVAILVPNIYIDKEKTYRDYQLDVQVLRNLLKTEAV